MFRRIFRISVAGLFGVAEEDEKNGVKADGLERTIALSDGVFAFAITLLVLDLAVPALSSGATSGDLLEALGNQYVNFVNFFLSFFIAGVWWSSHHRNFSHIRSSNTALRMLNLFFLMWIALLPFFTKLLSEYYNLQLSIALYAFDQAGAGAFISLVWWYASRNRRFIDRNMSKTAIRFSTWRNLIVPLFFLFSIGLSFVSVRASSYSWYGLIPIFIIILRLERRSEQSEQRLRKLKSPADLGK